VKKTEKVVVALLTLLLGIALLILRGSLISVLMSVVGIVFIAFGIIQWIKGQIVLAIIKAVIGIVLIICGWTVVSAVLYVLAAAVMITGILLLYEQLKNQGCGATLLQKIAAFAYPIVCILIGFFLLFNNGNEAQWVFIVSGSLTVLEGGLLLLSAFALD
jgi:hypothetical protein